MEESLKIKLLELAKKKLPLENDDVELFDYVGSNIDDAFLLGTEQGEVELAREILDLFCIKY